MAKIREALPEEMERVLGMYEWLFAPPGSVPPRWDPDLARAAIADAIAGQSATVLVAERRGALLGLCTAYLDLNSVRFGRRCRVEDLAVSLEHRSQGVGKALLDAAKEWARERRPATWSWTAPTPRTGRSALLRARGSELALRLLRLGVTSAGSRENVELAARLYEPATSKASMTTSTRPLGSHPARGVNRLPVTIYRARS